MEDRTIYPALERPRGYYFESERDQIAKWSRDEMARREPPSSKSNLAPSSEKPSSVIGSIVLPKAPPAPVQAPAAGDNNGGGFWAGIAVVCLGAIGGAIALKAAADKKDKETQEAVNSRGDAWHDYLVRRKSELGSQGLGITLNNLTQVLLRASILYQIPDASEKWMTRGWFNVAPGKSLDTDIVTTNLSFYVHFKTSDDVYWSGNGDGTGNYRWTVVHPNLRFDYDYGTLPSSGQKLVSMAPYTSNCFGECSVNFP